MSKLVITLFQCKRVVFPYLFIKYALPTFLEEWEGEVKVFFIQHLENFGGRNHPHLPEGQFIMESGHLDDSKIELVKQWTKEGKYYPAISIPHKESFPIHPNMPTYRIGIETALKYGADYHLWIDDDVFVYPKNIKSWRKKMEGNLLGVFYYPPAFIPSGFILTTPAYDKKMLKYMENPLIWNLCSYEDVDQPDLKANITSKGVFGPNIDFGSLHSSEFLRRWRPGYGHIEYFLTEASENKIGDLSEPDLIFYKCINNCLNLISKTWDSVFSGEDKELIYLDFTEEEITWDKNMFAPEEK